MSCCSNCSISHNRRVSSALSAIPVAKRRRVAATLGLFIALFVAIAAVALTGRNTPAAPVFSGIAIAVAVLLGLIAWGVLHSIRLDESESRLDAATAETVAAHGASLCTCGHEHDPGELHVSDACAHDGSGTACSHDCATCVLRSH